MTNSYDLRLTRYELKKFLSAQRTVERRTKKVIYNRDYTMESTCNLEVGCYVRNGSETPGKIIELRELKPGYLKAIVQWEDINYFKIEEPQELKLIHNWELQWQWQKGKYIRLYDQKECFEVRAILAEIRRCDYYIQTAQPEKQLNRIKSYSEKIAYLQPLKLRSIKIDPQFKALIPPLEEQEKAQLEANLIEHGCRDAIVLWRNTIVDGHNRFELCQKNNLDFSIHFMDFEERKSAHDWIILNQLGRRNLSPKHLSDLRGAMYCSEKLAKGGDRRSENFKGQELPIENTAENFKGQELPFENTAEKIAKKTGSKPRTIKNDAKYHQALELLADNFGREYRPIINASNLTKSQVKELGKYADDEEYNDEIEAVLNDLEHKNDFRDNYQLFKNKANPQRFAIGQLVKIQFSHKSGLTEVQKHCDREYALITKVMEFTYDLKLLKNRTFQAKQEDLIAVDFAEYALCFSPDEFDRLCPHFESGREVEELAKKLVLNDVKKS